MEFKERLPRSCRMNLILVVVDRVSKYAYFIGSQHPFTTQMVVVVFLREVVRLHGILELVMIEITPFKQLLRRIV